MDEQTMIKLVLQNSSGWLKRYYLVRFFVAAIWVAAAFTVAKGSPVVAAALLVLYPLWDALANFIDAEQTGGLKSNYSQSFNFVASILTAACVAYALTIGMKPVLYVFGAWAFLAGISQLVTGVRRWKISGGQWVMILSGGQSAVVAIHFFQQANALNVPGIEAVAPYAGLGAFYFLLSGLWLLIGDARRNARTATA